jgi:hypothetical protein
VSRGGIKLSGPGLKKLRTLERRIGDISTVKRRIAATQSEEALNLIKEGFDNQRDPYGKRWKKRKRETKKTLGRKVLSGETSRLKDFAPKEISSKGFRVSATVDYASPHQKPRQGKRPQRMMVPSNGRGFPSAWRRPMNEAAEDAITEFLTGK